MAAKKKKASRSKKKSSATPAAERSHASIFGKLPHPVPNPVMPAPKPPPRRTRALLQEPTKPTRGYADTLLPAHLASVYAPGPNIPKKTKP